MTSNADITWYRSPWSRRDLVKMIAPCLTGIIASLFSDEIRAEMIVTCLVVVVLISGVTYSKLRWGLT